MSSGINIIIGENGTGKTHLLKMIYFAYNEKKDDILENKFVNGNLHMIKIRTKCCCYL